MTKSFNMLVLQRQKFVMIYRLTYCKYLLVLLLFTAISGQILAQDPVVFNISCEDGEVGQTGCVDITVENFTDIESFQLGINFNPTTILPTSVDLSSTCVPSLDVGNFPFDFINIGYIPTLWFIDVSGMPETCTDGDVLFTLCFEYVGDPGDCSTININSTGIEFIVTGTSGDLETEVNTCDNCIITNDLTIVSDYCEPSPGNDDGSIKFYTVGGDAPYIYTVSNLSGQIATGMLSEGEEFKLENLPSDTYSITVTSSSGQMVSRQIILTDNFPIIFFSDVTDPTCFNKQNGEIVLSSLQGGINPYNIQWSNGISSNLEIDDLGPGEYSVTITDATGCELSDTFLLDSDTLFAEYEIVTPLFCEVGDGAKVILDVSGGTPIPGQDYQFFINGDRYRNEPDSICVTENLFETNQIFVVQNSSPRCTSDVVTFDIAVENEFIVTQEVLENVSCKGADDGRVRIVAEVGNETNFFFKCEDINTGLNIGGVSSSNFYFNNNLIPGQYRIVMESSVNGCIDTFYFDITEPAEAFAIDTIVMSPSCTGNDGSIEIIPMGGTPDYSFDWNGAAGDTSLIDILNGGDFKVVVTDANGCIDSAEFSLPMGGILDVQADILQSISCLGYSDGSVIAEVSPPDDYTYEWTDDQGNILGDAQTLTDIGAGWYFIKVEAAGCEAIDSIFLPDPSGMAFEEVIITDPECRDGNGSIGVAVSGGFPNYSFVWLQKDSTTVLGIQSVLAPIGAGEYCVNVSDQAGCSIDTCVTMLNPPAIDVVVTGITGVGCSGQNSGQATVLASGGSQGATTFNYLWSSGETASNAIMLSPGAGWVIASDTKCASDTFYFSIPDAQPVIGEYTITPPTCADNCDASITIIPMGGTGTGFNVNWPQLGIDAFAVNDLCPNTYDFIVTDSKGCEFSGSLVITAPDTLLLTLNENLTRNVSCRSNTGTIAVDVAGGNGGYVFQWTNNVSSAAVAQDIPAGTYTVTVTDEKGCQDELMYTLDPALLVFASVSTPNEPNCFGELTCITATNASGGVGAPYSFQVNAGPLYPLDSCVSVFAGEHLISVFDEIGCSFDTTVTIAQPNPVTVELGDDIEVNIGEESDVITAFIDSDLLIDSMIWTTLDPFECTNDDCESIIVTPVQDQMVTIYVEDENGCSDTDQLMISVKDVRQVYFPNAFSPNDDGFNDFFQVAIGPGVEKIDQMIIYDRWGNKMFEQSDYTPDPTLNDGWDGSFNGNDVVPGVYIYYVVATFKDGRTLIYTGDITLIKTR
jgi:gliding motility-associated-like protein